MPEDEPGTNMLGQGWRNSNPRPLTPRHFKGEDIQATVALPIRPETISELTLLRKDCPVFVVFTDYYRAVGTPEDVPVGAERFEVHTQVSPRCPLS